MDAVRSGGPYVAHNRETTFETRTIIYDALFLALAEDFGTTLVTAGGKLLRAIEDTAFAHLAHPLARLDDLAL